MNKKIVLTIIDVTGIQNYIFRSNRLRESIGASELVANATSWWVFDVLCELFPGKTNIDPSKNPTNSISPFEAIQEDKAIESDTEPLNAEVIYVGGGNTLILFNAENADQANNETSREKLFTRAFTKTLLRDAPGLDVVIAHSSPFDIKDFSSANDIRNKHAEVREKIAINKSSRPMSSKMEGLAVSTQCVSTGGAASVNPLQAAGGDEEFKTLLDKYEDKYVSAEVFSKLEAVMKANKRLEDNLFGAIKQKEEIKRKLGEANAEKLGVPFEFDNLGGTKGETSLIAVVHTDGNGMGKRITEFSNKPEFDTNRKWIGAMRKMSRKIDGANLKALQETAGFLASKLEKVEKDKKEIVILKSNNDKSFELSSRWVFDRETNQRKEIICYPFRPIIFGGEDVAFICDGRIALDLTAFYLKALEQTKLADGKPLYGRAGVAIVKSHYPFRRAYDLAEDLARSAKVRVKEVETAKDKGDASALDWHIAFTGLAGDISEIRNREFKVEQRDLNMRPLSVGKRKNDSDWRTWENFVLIIREFQTSWEESRNKAKSLREALRGGENKVEQFRKLFDKTLPKFEVNEINDFQTKGWHNEVCAYFDALEMMDLYFSLEDKSSADNEDKTNE